MLELAHGIVGRTDLPIPEWLFGWAAAVVLVVSFVALAVLWPQPRLQDGGFAALPARLSRVLASRAVEVAVRRDRRRSCSGWWSTAASPACRWPRPTSRRTSCSSCSGSGWCPSSVLFGDVFRAFNPWRALGRAVAWVAQTAARGADAGAARSTPSGWATGRPRRASFAFATLELVVVERRARPRTWRSRRSSTRRSRSWRWRCTAWSAGCDRGEAFSVYFNLFSRISPVEPPRRRARPAAAAVRAGRAGSRCPARCCCWR